MVAQVEVGLLDRLQQAQGVPLATLPVGLEELAPLLQQGLMLALVARQPVAALSDVHLTPTLSKLPQAQT